ncbi:MAG: hypothetical protein HC871_12730 [Rhizobiales bacterium]|nr:hypothetical protein [Hyphomicrobiales bacterium]
MRPRQLAIWSLLALLVASAVVIETTGLLEPKVALDRHGHAVEDAVSLLPVPLGELSVIEVAADGKAHRFERDHHGAWFLHRHDDRAADAAAHDHGDHDHDDQHHAAPDDAGKIASASPPWPAPGSSAGWNV